MKSKKIVVGLAIILTFCMLTTCIPFDTEASEGNGIRDAGEEWIYPFIDPIDREDTVPSGYVPVKTIYDLNRVGTGITAESDYDSSTYVWTLDAKYVQMGDIVFSSTDDLNNSHNVKLDITAPVAQTDPLNIKITRSDNTPIEGLYVWVSLTAMKVTDSNGNVSFSETEYNRAIVCTIFVQGMDDADGDGNGDKIFVSHVLPANSSSRIVSFMNEGFDLNVGIVITGTDLKITLKDESNAPIANAYAWVNGYEGTTNSSGEVTFTGFDSTKDCVIVAGGMRGTDSFSIRYNLPANSVTVDTVIKSNGNFDPIGDYETSQSSRNPAALFRGTYDGNGYKITGLRVSGWAASIHQKAIGLFAGLENAEITNLGLEGGETVIASDPLFYTHAAVGGIVGIMFSEPQIINCYNMNTITSSSTNVSIGGIVGTGYTYISKSYILYCFNDGQINACSNTNSPWPVVNVGGIVGFCEGIIYHCYNSGNITGITRNNGGSIYIGGLAAWSLYWGVYLSYNTGTITALCDGTYIAAGGIGGNNVLSESCYNSGNIIIKSLATVSNEIVVGGISGDAGNIRNSYNIGETHITHASDSVLYVGGVNGNMTYMSSAREIRSCYFLKDIIYINGVLGTDQLSGNLAAVSKLDNLTATPTADQTSKVKTLIGLQDQSGYYYKLDGTAHRGWDFYSNDPTWRIYDRTMSGIPFIVGLISTDISDPADRSSSVGDTVTFEVTAGSIYSGLNYQWQISSDSGTTWSDVSGATLSEYSKTTASADDGKMYRCIVYHDHGALASKAATLTLFAAYHVNTPTIDVPGAYGVTITSGHDFSSGVPVGTDFTFSVSLNCGYFGTTVVEIDGIIVSSIDGIYTITGAVDGQVINITVSGAQAAADDDCHFSWWWLIVLVTVIAIIVGTKMSREE